MSSAKRAAGRLCRNIPPITRYPVLFAGRNDHVAVVVTRGLLPEQAEANAAHLVACWNACEGLGDDPERRVAFLRGLETGGVLALCHQHDGLRRSLIEALRLFPGNHPDRPGNDGSADLEKASDEALIVLLKDSIEAVKP